MNDDHLQSDAMSQVLAGFGKLLEMNMQLFVRIKLLERQVYDGIDATEDFRKLGEEAAARMQADAQR